MKRLTTGVSCGAGPLKKAGEEPSGDAAGDAAGDEDGDDDGMSFTEGVSGHPKNVRRGLLASGVTWYSDMSPVAAQPIVQLTLASGVVLTGWSPSDMA